MNSRIQHIKLPGSGVGHVSHSDSSMSRSGSHDVEALHDAINNDKLLIGEIGRGKEILLVDPSDFYCNS
jgi:hypothetical protein